MGKTPLYYILTLFLLVFPMVNAQSLPPTTTFMGNSSTTATDYTTKYICAGTFFDGTVCQAFTSSNIALNASTGSTATASTTQLNLTRVTAGRSGFRFGGTSNKVGIGWACDVRMTFTGTIGMNFAIGGLVDPWQFATSDEPAFQTTNGVASNFWQVGQQNFLNTDTPWNPTSTVNYTIIFTNATGMKVFANNSNANGYAITGASYSNFPYNFSAFADDLITNGNKFVFDSVICYNATTGAAAAPAAPSTPNLTITAINIFNSTSINNFSVSLEGLHSQSTSNGTILLVNVTHGVQNLTFYTAFGFHNYINKTYSVNVSGQSFQAKLTPMYYFFNSGYSNYVSYNGVNYTRNLSYFFNISCPSFIPSYFELLVNASGSVQEASLINCTNSSRVISGNYVYGIEGQFGIFQRMNSSAFGNTIKTRLQNFTSDLNNPTVDYLNISIGSGFAPPLTNVTLRCLDTIAQNLTYLLTLNSVQLEYTNHSNNYTTIKPSSLNNGINTAIGNCSDFFGSSQSTLNRTAYIGYISLIDEKDNTPFNLANITGARVYFDTNSSYYDFKTTNTNSINFTTSETNQLRFELVYADGSIITRYVDINLINGEVRVCANKEGTTHYQQLIISATEQPVILKNVFSNCVIAADYTRFAYQDALTLQAFSIASLYYLYTYLDNVQTFLASVDGSISTFINIDQLQFNAQGYNLNILGDALTFAKISGVVVIYYNNLAEDNTAVSVTITRTDTNEVVLTLPDSTFTNKNEFNINFDYTTLSGINETVLFKIDLQKTNGDGTSTLTRYFNTNASSGGLNPFVAAVFSILLTIFGLTLASARITFSWFGILIEIGAIAILTFAVNNWYITMLLGLNVIMLIFIVLILTAKNYPSLQ